MEHVRCPIWLLRLVDQVEQYESTHGTNDHDINPDECFDGALKSVPNEVRSQARGYRTAIDNGLEGLMDG